MSTGERTGLFVTSGAHRYRLAETDEFTFGRADANSHCLDPGDTTLSRQVGRIYFDGGSWFVWNTSTANALELVDDRGLASILAPSRRALVEGRVTLRVRGSRPKPHVLEIDAPPRADVGAAPETVRTGVTTEIGQDVTITDDDRMAMTALFAGYLESGERYDPYPRTYEAAAFRLGVPASTVRKRIEHLRKRLELAGVPEMNGLAGLAKYALARELITKADLRALRDG